MPRLIFKCRNEFFKAAVNYFTRLPQVWWYYVAGLGGVTRIGGEGRGMLRDSGYPDADLSPVSIQHSASSAVPLDEAAAMPVGDAGGTAKIVRIDGSVTIFRTDGSPQQAKRGDFVAPDDAIETGADGGAGVAFLDGTILNLSARTRIAIGEFLYDPSGRSNSGLVRVVQGAVAFIAGKMAASGRLDIETPIGTVRVRGAASSSGIGVVTLAGLTLYGIENAHAIGPDPILENDRIGYYGTYVLLSRDDPSQILAVINDPDVVVVFRGRGSAAEYFAITPAQRAEYQGAYQDALRTFLIGQQDMFFNQAGPGGSGTPPGTGLVPLLFDQFGHGLQLLK